MVGKFQIIIVKRMEHNLVAKRKLEGALYKDWKTSAKPVSLRNDKKIYSTYETFWWRNSDSTTPLDVASENYIGSPFILNSNPFKTLNDDIRFGSSHFKMLDMALYGRDNALIELDN